MTPFSRTRQTQFSPTRPTRFSRPLPAHFIAIVLLMAAFSTSVSNALAQNTTPLYPAGIQHVIVVGCDGMSPNGIRMANSPVMHRLIANGAVKWNVRTVYPSVSSPNWASMIMGAGVEQHGIIDNDWERGEYSLPSIVRSEEGIFPTIFGQVRKNYPRAEIGAAYQWEGFGRLFEKKAVNFDKNYPNEDETTKGFIGYIEQKKPLFAFMHLDLVDDAGHEFGHGSEEYYKAVSKADSLIGEVVAAIKKAGIEENTLFIVTADHGGVGYGHGGATIEEMEIATIYYGKGVKKGYKIQQPVVTFDLAATIAFALKITPPYVWTGRPVKSAFQGFSEPANQYIGRELIPSPQILPGKHLYAQAGGLYINKTATVSMNTLAENATTRYSVDGSDPDSTSPVYSKPFVVEHTTVVKASSFDKTGNQSPTAVAFFRLVDSTKGNGLHVKFYKGHDWKYLPPFHSLTPAGEWTSYEFAIDRSQILGLLGTGDPTFGAIFSGYLQIDTEGDYKFYNSSDDGSTLYVDDKLVVNNDGDHGVIERSGDIHLTAGRHPIRVEFYNGFGSFWLDAYYKGPGIVKQLIPANKLFLENK